MSRFRKVAWICCGIYWGLLFLGTHLPSGSVPRAKVNDKLLHFCGFAGLSFLLALASTRRRPTIRGMLTALATLALYAVFDEWTQSFVPGRKTEFWDWCADMAGSMVGIVSYVVVFLSWRRQADCRGCGMGGHRGDAGSGTG